MDKNCDVCRKKLGFRKFRYSEGIVCPECYKKASKNFTETITKKSYQEIVELCEQDMSGQLDDVEFEITAKIGNYILFDEKNKKICVPYNRAITKERKIPEVFCYEEIDHIEFISHPSASRQQLEEWRNQKEDKVIRQMEIVFYMNGKVNPIKISLLSSPVRIKSFAFHRTFRFAQKILDQVDRKVNNEEKREKIKV